MADEQKKCMACNERPAMPTVGILPLCSQCAALQKNPRGVAFEPKEEDPPEQPSKAS